ncbi:hypothetical protein CDAR_226911 [Caerostris darwini]|uniref:Uncharacterized protein n=1 Tax=Caerostris darwini TaxID=1538125 RepID=A0AAV4VX08_9ARAC|nr:hypothetical protein CDAR_226911 [Caerostris darwini]
MGKEQQASQYLAHADIKRATRRERALGPFAKATQARPKPESALSSASHQEKSRSDSFSSLISSVSPQKLSFTSNDAAAGEITARVSWKN